MLCHVTYCNCTVQYSLCGELLGKLLVQRRDQRRRECQGRQPEAERQQTAELVTLSFRFLKINIKVSRTPDDPGTRVSTYDAAQAPVMVVMDGSRAFIVVP